VITLSMWLSLAGAGAPAPSSLVELVAFERRESRAEQLASLKKGYDSANQAWEAKLAAEKDPAARAALQAQAPKAEWLPRFKDFVAADATDEQAFEALEWLVRNAEGAERAWSFERIEAHHLARPGLERTLAGLAPDRAPRTRTYLQTVLAKGGTELARGHACFTLAQQSQGYGAAARRYASFTEEERARWKKSVGEDFVALIESRPAAEFEAEAEQLFARCVKEFGTLDLRGEPLAKRAEAYLFELQNLSIGKLAPEIEAQDLSGVTFKLSDYRGKVVVLDFWGHW